MSGVLAVMLALLVYPGLVGALVVAWVLTWTRDATRASLGSGARPGPLSLIAEIRATYARDTLAPAATALAFQAILPILALALPLVALVLLPLPGNPLADALGLKGDLIAEGALLLGVPGLRLLTGWATPSPYTRLAADRGARLLAGCVLPLVLALSALAQQVNTLQIAPLVHAPAQAQLNWLSLLARVLAAAAFACCLPVLARASALREGEGDADLAAGELAEASGRDLAAWRVAEGLQLVAAVVFFAAAFIQPLLVTASPQLRGAAWIVVPILAAIGIGAWEGLRGAQPASGDRPPLSWWFGLPLLLALFALVAAAFAARGA
ncbi:MAG TPA: NADH-quinone oxidoreductase subunit H [Ktedonobacterales bacterium]